MANFLKGLLNKSRSANPEAEKIAEIMGEQQLDYVISAYDSTLRVNGEDEFIRRYALRVTAEPEVLADFIKMTGADKRNIQKDGTLMLLPPIPGSVDFFPQWLETLSEQLQDKGFTLPVQAIQTAIIQDMQAHPRPAEKRAENIR